MIIVNPLYDVIIKYLLEDIDIAHEFSLLGFPLERLKYAVVKINRQYKNVLKGAIRQDAKDDFIELLTHDSDFIQVRLLPPETKTKLERILQVFNPKFKTDDTHILDFTGDTNDPIVQKIVYRLQQIVANEEITRKMYFEDDFYSALDEAYNKGLAERLAKKDIVIAEKEQVIIEKEQVIIEKDQALSEKDQALENERQKNELLMQQLAALQKQNKK
jgi:hypothetical protein